MVAAASEGLRVGRAMRLGVAAAAAKRLRRGALSLCALTLVGCGGGGSAELYFGGGSAVPVARLDIALTLVGPRSVAVDWSDDPYAAGFTVARDGAVLADVDAIGLIDNTVQPFNSYCYQVSGYDGYGDLVSVSDVACITVGS